LILVEGILERLEQTYITHAGSTVNRRARVASLLLHDLCAYIRDHLFQKRNSNISYISQSLLLLVGMAKLSTELSANMCNHT